MVELVQKISANPLGVEYKMLGAEDDFVEGWRHHSTCHHHQDWTLDACRLR